jgi:hypothetical protein
MYNPAQYRAAVVVINDVVIAGLQRLCRWCSRKELHALNADISLGMDCALLHEPQCQQLLNLRIKIGITGDLDICYDAYYRS